MRLFANRFAPILTLLLEVVIFHRNVLTGKTVIPWDIRAYHLPLALFFTKSLRDGELPLWNPMNYCGYPFAANVQTAIYYPPRVLAMLLGGTSASRMLYFLELDVLLHIVFAGVSCYFLLREFHWNRTVCTVGATAFQLGGFFASQIEHVGAMEGMSWLPLIWLLLHRSARRFTLVQTLLLSASLSMAILAGFTPVTSVVFLSSGLLVIALLMTRQTGPHLLGTYLAACAIAVVLSAAVLFPAAELMLASVSRYRSDWLGNGGGLPLRSLLSLVWPNTDRVLERGLYQGRVDPTLMYLYSGAVIIVGALVFFARRRFLQFPAVTLMLFVSALFMLGVSTPFGRLYGAVFPPAIRGVLYPQEWIGPFSLALCLVAVCGVASCNLHPRLLLVLAGIAIFDLTWFGSNRPFNSTDPLTEPGVTESAFSGSPELLNIVRALTNVTVPPSRIDTINDGLDWVGSNPTTGVPTAGGADPMAPIRAIQVRLAFTPGERWGYYYQATNIQSPVLPALNVCCILTRTRLSEGQRANSSYQTEYTVPGGFVYESNSTLPRFYLVHRTVPALDLQQASALLKDSKFRPADVAIVEGASNMVAAVADPAKDRVTILRYRRNTVELETDSPAASYLASSETNYPGWHARVDGQPATIYTTNVAFRGLPLAAGKHRVDFAFRPAIVAWSVAISVCGWLAFAVLFASRFRRRVLLH